jgi:hypothetical protein
MEELKAKLAAQELQLEKSETLGPVFFHGKSMSPFLEDGDELIVVSVEWDEIRIGDIVTYRLDDRFPTYRVLSKKEDKLVLKPDNWTVIFEVMREDVLGRVVERRRNNSSLNPEDWLWIFAAKRILFENWRRSAISKIRYARRRIRELLKGHSSW